MRGAHLHPCPRRPVCLKTRALLGAGGLGTLLLSSLYFTFLNPEGHSTDPELVSPSHQHGEEVSPAASDLAMVLTHSLSLEHQKSSRDSLQFSSGYSTQNTTPSCSEDTIPSQGRTSRGTAPAWEGQGGCDQAC